MRGIFTLILLLGAAPSLAQPVARGAGFIAPAPRIMADAGPGEMRDYFFRVWDMNRTPAAWSPALPKICHSGFDGLSDDPVAQFTIGRDTGGYENGQFSVDVRYDINSARGMATDSHAIIVVRSWQRSAVNGHRCLIPRFAPDGMTAPINARALFDGRPMTRPSMIDVLPCGVLFDEEPAPGADFSAENFSWNPRIRRFECDPGFTRRDSSRAGAPLWTYVDFYLDFPNGGGLRSRMNIRRCYECR